jgi:hypothetical protein
LAPICGERRIIPDQAESKNDTNGRQAAIFGGSMGHAENQDCFNILFVLTFFASFAMVVVHFG